jgi:alpha-ketoglutaric semialdehyde dehydrogenase
LDTSDFVCEYAQADVIQVGAAVGAAHATFAARARTTPQERHDILPRASTEILTRREELARLLAREEGKTLLEAAYAMARWRRQSNGIQSPVKNAVMGI